MQSVGLMLIKSPNFGEKMRTSVGDNEEGGTSDGDSSPSENTWMPPPNMKYKRVMKCDWNVSYQRLLVPNSHWYVSLKIMWAPPATESM